MLSGKREPLYAGSWYEAEPDRLRYQLGTLLERAEPLVDPASQELLSAKTTVPAADGPVLAIVAPHAGYMFSGQAAAHSWKAISNHQVERLVLLGPSHHVGLTGAALPSAATFSTPLGDLAVDSHLVGELKDYQHFSLRGDVHAVEHSLELQLPFVKYLFPQATIVPIVVGALPEATEARLIAEILRGYLRPKDILVVSSDFTHYGPRYRYEPFGDNIRQNIQKLDRQAVEHMSRLDLDGFVEFQRKTRDTICGFYPLCVLLGLLPPGASLALLRYYTSQDTPGEDRQNSVSYLSLSFAGQSWQDGVAQAHLDLSSSDRQGLLQLARRTLDSCVRRRQLPGLDDLGIEAAGALRLRAGAFVTLNKRQAAGQGKDWQLRGCMGYIWPLKPLYQAIIENTVSACCRDYRFSPVRADELAHITIELSVLTPPRRVSTWRDIVLGRDGIVLLKDSRQAVFLPSVPAHFGWDLAATLTQLSCKAGLNGQDWQEGARFDTFQAQMFEEEDR